MINCTISGMIKQQNLMLSLVHQSSIKPSYNRSPKCILETGIDQVFGLNCSETLLIQKRSPVGSGPSSNTCPR